MSQDRNPYYDSIRDKPDRSEFASLRAGLESSRHPPPSGLGFWKIALILVALVVVAVVVKRYVL